MARRPLIAGNWKMNYNHLEAIAHVQKLSFSIPKTVYENTDVALIPPFTDIRSVQTLIDGDKLEFAHGAQDLSEHDSGAYTGDISGSFLASLGCSYVVVGHSERREYHQESNEQVGAKIRAALRFNLTPIVCVGERIEVREKGDHINFVTQQVKETLHGLDKEQLQKIVIAYEPIWAIGTGKVASAADAEEVCAHIRTVIQELSDVEVSSTLRILYGGSVSGSNIDELIAQANIDGALVGGASLKPEDFTTICAATSQHYK